MVAEFADAALNHDEEEAPWAAMFKAAHDQEIANGRPGDIIPFWIHPGDAKIERVVLMLPFSKEKDRYEDLIKSLATYRLAFGQPRQDELIELFSGMSDEVHAEIADLQISLRPKR